MMRYLLLGFGVFFFLLGVYFVITPFPAMTGSLAANVLFVVTFTATFAGLVSILDGYADISLMLARFLAAIITTAVIILGASLVREQPHLTLGNDVVLKMIMGTLIFAFAYLLLASERRLEQRG